MTVRFYFPGCTSTISPTISIRSCLAASICASLLVSIYLSESLSERPRNLVSEHLRRRVFGLSLSLSTLVYLRLWVPWCRRFSSVPEPLHVSFCASVCVFVCLSVCRPAHLLSPGFPPKLQIHLIRSNNGSDTMAGNISWTIKCISLVQQGFKITKLPYSICSTTAMFSTSK